MRPLRLVAWILAVLLVAHAAATWGTLPERVPVHIGADGRADRFAERSVLSWFALPGGGVLLAVLFGYLTALIPRRPDLLNVPDKERLLALPPRWRAPVDREVARMLDATLVGVLLIFGVVQVQVAGEATGGPTLPPVVVHVAAIALSLGLLGFVVRITGAIDDADRAWRAAGSPAE